MRVPPASSDLPSARSFPRSTPGACGCLHPRLLAFHPRRRRPPQRARALPPRAKPPPLRLPGASGFLRPSRRTRAPSPPARLRFAAAVGIPGGSRMPPASPAGTGAGPSRETSPTPSIRNRELARRVEFCDARLEVTTATSDVRSVPLPSFAPPSGTRCG